MGAVKTAAAASFAEPNQLAPRRRVNKDKFVPLLNQAPRLMGVLAPAFLASELDGGGWSPSRSGRFSPRG
jgi:hypothetical protein